MIGIVGIGRLGLCNALFFEKHGFDVIGYDVRESYVKSLNDKTFSSDEPQVNELLRNSKNFRATTNIQDLCICTDIFVVVNTPTGTNNSYDTTNLGNVLVKLNEMTFKSNPLIVVCCTVAPTYMDTIASILIPKHFDRLFYNPEFIAQGNIINGMTNPDIILIGGKEKIGDSIQRDTPMRVYQYIYGKDKFLQKVRYMSFVEAEITKLSINCFITTKISFANMVGDICKASNVKPELVLNACGGDSRIGNKYLNWGWGFGGPCFPRDNRALGEYASSIGVNPLISKATDEQNKEHERLIVDAIEHTKDEFVTFRNVAYKDNCPVAIIEESSKLRVAKMIAEEKKHRVKIVDRKEIIDEVRKKYGNIFEYEII